VHAITVQQPRARLRKIAVPRLVGTLADFDSLDFVTATRVEQAQLNLLGMCRE
jgi:hypothetical protein